MRVSCVYQKAGVFYVGIILAVGFLVNWQMVESGAKIRTKQFFQPDAYADLLNIQNHFESSATLSAGELKSLDSYIYFYEKYVEYVPGNADAYTFLGLCQYYRQDKEAAVHSFNMAVKSNQDFFWPYYNLGIIAFREKNYTMAREVMQYAVGKKPDAAL